jgi:hypothetical protein
MGEPKEKQSSSLRQPKPKKTLGLRPPTMLRMPHDDLIKPEAPPEPRATEITTPVVTPAETPVTTTAPTPVVPIENPDRQAPQYLDATHTSSEAQIYSIMYRETVSKNMRERHFGPTELMKKTGIRSDRTVRRAIDGLLAKLSIEITKYSAGSPLGPRYRVYKPKEIELRRKAAGLEIDPFTKQITTPATTPVATPVATGDKNYRGTAVADTPATPVNFAGVIKYRNDIGELEDSSASSSSKSTNPDDEEARLNSIREAYERATQNSWTTADAVTAQTNREVPAAAWGIAICYCVDRAPGHKFNRLAYTVAEAHRHAELMRGYTDADLRAILKHSLRTIERARELNLWEAPLPADE